MPDDNQSPIVSDLAGAGQLANSKVANKVYDDALAPLLKQLGELGEDVAKTGRLILFPFQVLAWGQDRFAKWMKELADDVPEERRQEAPPEVAGPVLRNLVFMTDESPLSKLYLELLKRAIDRERCREVHPAFVRIIEQMSPDEAMVMYILRDRSAFAMPPKEDVGPGVQLEQQLQDGWTYRGSFPRSCLAFPERFEMYVLRLKSLTLAETIQGHVGDQVFASEFGRMFTRACIPNDFEIRK